MSVRRSFSHSLIGPELRGRGETVECDQETAHNDNILIMSIANKRVRSKQIQKFFVAVLGLPVMTTGQ